MKHLSLVLTCIVFVFTGFIGVLPCYAQAVDFEVRLNDGGFVSFDPFKAEIAFRNSGDVLPGARVFAILEVFGEFFFWPEFTSRFDYEVMDVLAGETDLTILEFTFPDIAEFIPFGPLYFWGAWFQEQDNQAIDVVEFWLDADHKWTPTPSPTTPTPTPPAMTPTPFTEPGSVYAIDPIVGNLRCVPSGSFTQGSPETEPCRSTNETQFVHTLSRNLAGMETEVSENMWELLRAVQPSLPFSDGTYPGSHYPMNYVSWHEAILFANLLSQYDGYPQCYYTDPQMTVPIDATNYLEGHYYCDFDATGYRLPTEGEWEYICRAGTTGAFSCEEPEYNAGNCDSCNAGFHPVLEQHCLYCRFTGLQTVGSFLPNPWNFYDMHGSVFEWCWDWSGPYPVSGTDFTGAASGFYRVARGGSYIHEASLARSAFRAGILPHIILNHIGFRLVRTIN